MLFSSTSTDKINLNIDGQIIKQEENAKFIGIIFDSKLTWKSHIKFTHKKATVVCNMLKAFAGTTWGSHPLSILKVYKGYVRALIEWGSLCYSNASKSLLKKLDQIQNAAIRIATGLLKCTNTYNLYKISNLQPLAVRKTYITDKFILKLSTVSNKLHNK